MATAVIMPKLGMAQEVGQVIQWLKDEGEVVKEGEPLLEVMTDKVTMEVESPTEGVLVGVLADADEIVPVAETIAFIVEPGEEFQPPPKPNWQEIEVGPQNEQSTSVNLEPQANTHSGNDKPNKSTPVAQRLATERGLDLAEIRGSGREGKVTRADVVNHLQSLEDQIPEAIRTGSIPENAVRATPNARRLAHQFQLDLTEVRGSGPSGRIQGDDVIAYLSESSPSRRSSSRQSQIIPLHGVRKVIADRMTHSAQTTPHIKLEIKVDTTRAQALRDEANERYGLMEADRISLTSLWVKSTAWALTMHPWMNASIQDDSIILHPEINIGIATALDDGLIVPVIHNTDQKDLLETNQELRDLATRARSGELKPEEVSGGTFTVSNLGMFGILRFSPIINPPESGILAIGAIQRTPVVETDEDQLIIRPMMNLSLAADHRVIDGAGAARFLMDLKRAIEHPDLLLL